ncbi:MAG: leucine-rich repeat domain-containing protein [Prevotella sp.]|nr:leucine-rich repeat domain-containing protein [Prevotella sp.]
MKRFCLLCIPLLLLGVQARAYDFEADDANGNRLSYTISGTNVSVASETTYSGNVIIPETVTDGDGNEYTVTSIEASGFANGASLTSVTIPSTITSIGNDAFQNCTSLATVNFNATECSDFRVIISIHPFYGCSALTTVNIGASVTKIPDYLLYDISSVTTLTFADNSALTSIGNYAFNECSSLQSVTLPENLTSIGNYAFCSCTKLATVTFEENSALTTIGKYAFYNCALTEITIPENVETIDNYAFEDCTELATVTFEESSKLTTIGTSAFYNCKVLTEITIPENVTTIGNEAFNSCTNLATVTFEESSKLTSIGTNAFKSSGLTEITIPENMTTIGTYAFYGCSLLASVTLPDGLTSLGIYAFYGCSALTEITIPENVTSIGNYSFKNCTSLATLNFNATTCSDFSSAEPLDPFCGCSALTTVNIGANVTTIPSYFLRGITSLTTLTIADDSQLTSIGTYAFYGCTDLKTIICNATTPPTCGDQAFYQINEDAWLVVPEGYSKNYTSEGTIQALKATQTGWSDITHMREATVSFPMRTTEGYATHYSPYEYTLADNLEATTITSADSDGKLTMYWEFGHGTYTDGDGIEKEQSPTVPAGVAVLLHEVVPNNKTNESNIGNDTTKEYGSYSNTTVNWEDEETPTNMLYGSKVATTTTVGEDGSDDDYYFYKFAYWYNATTDDNDNTTYSDDGVLGFYWGDEKTGGAFQIDANLAWLAIPRSTINEADGDSNAKLYGYPLVDGDGNDLYGNNHNGNDIDGSDRQTTQIDGVDADGADNADIIYNMAGQRVNDMSRRGVYIVNGRKVAVK